MQRVPYMVIVGEKEMEEGTISVRKRDEGDLGAMKLEELVGRIKDEV
jgi:threonyl-tRNA synthetase